MLSEVDRMLSVLTEAFRSSATQIGDAYYFVTNRDFVPIHVVFSRSFLFSYSRANGTEGIKDIVDAVNLWMLETEATRPLHPYEEIEFADYESYACDG